MSTRTVYSFTIADGVPPGGQVFVEVFEPGEAAAAVRRDAYASWGPPLPVTVERTEVPS